MAGQMIFNEDTKMAYPYNEKILAHGKPWIVLDTKDAIERAQNAQTERINLASKANAERVKAVSKLLKGKPAGAVPAPEPKKSAKNDAPPPVVQEVVVPEVPGLPADMLTKGL